MSDISLRITAADGARIWPRGRADVTHIARPVPKDEAREAVIAAARALRPAELGHATIGEYHRLWRELEDALDRLDALDAT